MRKTFLAVAVLINSIGLYGCKSTNDEYLLYTAFPTTDGIQGQVLGAYHGRNALSDCEAEAKASMTRGGRWWCRQSK